MIGLAPSEIRQRIAAAIRTLDGWTESRWVYDLYPLETSSLAHRSYAVGVSSSTPVDRDRQRRAVGVLMSSSVSVRWLHRVRADRQVADYDDALDSELALMAAIAKIDNDPDLSLRLDSIPSRSIVGDGTYLLGELSFIVLHRYSLGG